ncbi:MAG TPA: hypothetical protein VFT04_08515 [Gemmatimonadales bacterium]|nr:hypothetical protein [Gemmatimonadales bacterium]
MHRDFLAAATLLVAAAPATAGAQRGAPTISPVAVPASLATLEFTGSSLIWVDDSTLALLDNDAKQFVTAEIRHGTLRRHGREGSGPGEFRAPVFLLARDGEVLVDDITTRRISRFDRKRRFIASVPTPGATLQLLGWSGDRVRIAWTSFMPGGGPTISDIDLTGGAAFERFQVLARDPSLASPMPGGAGNSAFLAVAPGPRGSIVVGSPRPYRITVFDSAGRPLHRFGRDLPPVFRTPAEIDAMVTRSGRMLAGAPVNAEQRGNLAARLRETLGKEPKPHFPWMGGIVVDQTGGVWVLTTRGSNRTDFDVFSAAGDFRGTVTTPGRVVSFTIRGSHLAVLAERTEGDDEGFQGIDLYRIARP